MSGATGSPGTVAAADGELLETVLQEAVDAVLETCSLQLDRHYAPLPDHLGGRAGDDPWYASSIELPTDGGRWELVLVGERSAVEELARSMFGMERDEPVTAEDVADALNEVTNVAAGLLKSYRLDAGQRISIALPSFHEEPGNYLDHSHHQQLLDRHGHRLRVLVRWLEGEKP